MLGWFKERSKFAKLAGIWIDVTGLIPGDSGQIAVYASGILKQSPMTPEDAWLSALMNWTYNMPDVESKVMLADGLLKFLVDGRQQSLFSAEARGHALMLAREITGK
jgi:hypothetical protein